MYKKINSQRLIDVFVLSDDEGKIKYIYETLEDAEKEKKYQEDEKFPYKIECHTIIPNHIVEGGSK